MGCSMIRPFFFSLLLYLKDDCFYIFRYEKGMSGLLSELLLEEDSSTRVV